MFQYKRVNVENVVQFKRDTAAKKIIRGWGGGVFAGGGGGGCWMMAWSNFVSFNKFRKFVFNSPLPQC